MPSSSLILLCCLGLVTTALGDFVTKLAAAIAEGERRGYDTGVSAAAVNPVGIPFPCTPYSTAPAQTVHQLTPADVKVIGAIGDSITAAMDAKADSILTALTEYRGVSWSVGGDGDVSNTATLPNIVKKYNPGIKGFSTGTGSETDSNSRLNVAVSGAISGDLLSQAYDMINKIKADSSININTDWKVITLWIGRNDLCEYCSDTGKYSAANYANHIATVLDTLRSNLPRTFVNLVQILDVTQLAPLGSLWCDLVHTNACYCATTGSTTDKQMTSAASQAYRTALENLINTGRYDTSDDFTVVLQPFPGGIELPYQNGQPDKSYFAPDCFHFSTKGHKEMAVALWNNMLQPVGQKATDWTLNQAVICPSTNAPYFYTRKNSPAVAGAAGGFSVSSADSAAAITEGERKGYDTGVSAAAVNVSSNPNARMCITDFLVRIYSLWEFLVHQLTPVDVKVIGAIGDSILLQDETTSDGPTPLQTNRDEEQGTTSMLQDEAILLEQLLDSISMKDTPSCAECIRGVPESLRGTPPSMDETKRVIWQTVESIKELMIDIAHASHHADHLARAAELGVLSKGLSVVPRMMLMYADDITKAEWLAQVRISTLGFMKVSERHHRRIIDKRKTEIADLQAKALKAIDSSQTNQKQKKALKGTYEELLKAAAGAARKVKDQQDLATESKLEGPGNKRPRTDHESPSDMGLP